MFSDIPLWMQEIPPFFWWKFFGDDGWARMYDRLSVGAPDFDIRDDAVEIVSDYHLRNSNFIAAT